MLSLKPWRAEAVIQLIAAILGSLCLGVTLAVVLGLCGVAAFKSPDSFASLLAGTLSFQGAVWVFMAIFFKWHDMSWRDALGLRGPGLLKAILIAVATLLVFLPVVLGLQQICAAALDRLGWPPDEQRAVDLFARSKSIWLRGYLAVFAVVIAPVAEEFIFRGILFPFIKQLRAPLLVGFLSRRGWPQFAWFLRRRGWVVLAWLGVNGVFALIHFNLPTLLPLFVLSLALTWLYEHTDRLIAPIVAHSLFNTANLLLLLLRANHP